MVHYIIQKNSDNPVCADMKLYPRPIVRFKSKLQKFI